ncbi:hypothetical protein K7X08_000082 [Anisodus acutangulus]|uniref:Uncharacterized protein n=1 Tax=Anisodus acutangulus TaxID=402998 RepID=A0A9Q1M2T1_9SOLA|nr:hypothetical protein K7X08_000082 [Anisodus acutangulus]
MLHSSLLRRGLPCATLAPLLNGENFFSHATMRNASTSETAGAPSGRARNKHPTIASSATAVSVGTAGASAGTTSAAGGTAATVGASTTNSSVAGAGAATSATSTIKYSQPMTQSSTEQLKRNCAGAATSATSTINIVARGPKMKSNSIRSGSENVGYKRPRQLFMVCYLEQVAA